MHKLFVEQIPWYAAGTLPPRERAAFARHLAGCVACQQALGEWRAIARATQAMPAGGDLQLPPLSRLITAAPQRRAPLWAILRGGLHLIWAQRSVLRQGGVFSGLVLFLVLGLVFSGLTSLGAGGDTSALVVASLIPLVAITGVAMLYGPEVDPAFDLVATTPTHPATLLFARLTLLLALLTGLALLGSGGLSSIGLQPFSTLIYLWLGPMLSLASLTTLLVLLCPTAVALAVPALGWIAVVAVAGLESQGLRVMRFSLRPLLEPHLGLLGIQVAFAAGVWVVSAMLLHTGAVTRHMGGARL